MIFKAQYLNLENIYHRSATRFSFAALVKLPKESGQYRLPVQSDLLNRFDRFVGSICNRFFDFNHFQLRIFVL